MLKQITKRYKELMMTGVRLLSLLVLCTVIGTLIVLPLWEFAVKSPSLYTYTTLTVMAVISAFLFYRWIRANGVKYSLLKLSRLFILLMTLCLCIYLVLNGKKLLCIPTLIAAVILYGFFGNSERPSSDK